MKHRTVQLLIIWRLSMKDEWVSSDILGSNYYKLIDGYAIETSEIARTRDLDPYNDVIEFKPVRGQGDARELSIVYAPFGIDSRWAELINLVEESQNEFLYDSGYMWPVDCVSAESRFGYIVRKYSDEQYDGIAEYFVKPLAERWKLSEKLLMCVAKIHESGFALNGITREQIRVDKKSGDILLFPGFYLSRTETCRFDASRSGFFLIPEIIRRENIGAFSAQKHDLYSVASIVFYLLFYTHPFIGGKFWPYPHDQYYSQYTNHPEFIFADGSGNCLQNLEFDNIITDQWEKTDKTLRALFKDLYEEVCSAGKRQAPYVWNLSYWLEAVKADAAVNDNSGSRPDFPFETVVNYKV